MTITEHSPFPNLPLFFSLCFSYFLSTLVILTQLGYDPKKDGCIWDNSHYDLGDLGLAF